MSNNHRLPINEIRELTTNGENGRGDLVASKLTGLTLPDVMTALQDMRTLSQNDVTNYTSLNKLEIQGSEDKPQLLVASTEGVFPLVDIDGAGSKLFKVTSRGSDLRDAVTPQNALPSEQRGNLTRALEAGHGEAIADVVKGTDATRRTAIFDDVYLQNLRDLQSKRTHTELSSGFSGRPLTIRNQYGDVLVSIDSDLISGQTTDVKTHEVPPTKLPLDAHTLQSLELEAEQGNGKNILNALNGRSQRESEAIMNSIIDLNVERRRHDESLPQLSNSTWRNVFYDRDYCLQIYDRTIVEVSDSIVYGYAHEAKDLHSK